MGWIDNNDVESVILGYAKDICQELGLDLQALYSEAYPDEDALWVMHQPGIKATTANIEAVLSDLTDINCHSFAEVFSKAVGLTP